MKRLLAALLCAGLAACQPGARNTDEGRFYSYVDAQGNLVTVERAPAKQGEQASSAAKSGGAETEMGGEGPPNGGNPEAMEVDPDQYQTPEQATQGLKEKVREDERDRFISYRGPEGEIITRPLDLVAEREAAEHKEARKKARAFERLPDSGRYKESTSRVPADCCRHLIEDAGLLERGSNIRLRFKQVRHVKLDRDRPARVLRLGPEVGALEIRSFIRENQYLAPRLLVLNAEGRPILKINNMFTRYYPENWARYGYMGGRVERSRDFAYLVFYLPYAVMDENGPRLEPDAQKGAGEFKRALTGELALTGRRGPISGGPGQ